jgi:hypothetical protein
MSSTSRAVLLAVTYLVLTFPIAAVWHLGLFPQSMAGPAFRSQPLFVMGLLSTVLQAIVVAYLYPRLQRGGPPVREGLRFALIMGSFIASYGVLAEAGKFEVGPTASWVLYEGAFFVVQWLVIGVALALVYQWTAGQAVPGQVVRQPSARV